MNKCSSDYKKGAWTPEVRAYANRSCTPFLTSFRLVVQEDELLRQLVTEHGPKNWSVIASGITGRSGKSCRLRWCNQLNPDVKKEPFSEWEDAVVITAHATHGNKWAGMHLSCAQVLQIYGQQGSREGMNVHAHLPSSIYVILYPINPRYIQHS